MAVINKRKKAIKYFLHGCIALRLDIIEHTVTNNNMATSTIVDISKSPKWTECKGFPYGVLMLSN